MTIDRLNQLDAEAAEDLAEARRQRHSAWIATLLGRQQALREIRKRVPPPPAREPRPSLFDPPAHK